MQFYIVHEYVARDYLGVYMLQYIYVIHMYFMYKYSVHVHVYM